MITFDEMMKFSNDSSKGSVVTGSGDVAKSTAVNTASGRHDIINPGERHLAMSLAPQDDLPIPTHGVKTHGGLKSRGGVRSRGGITSRGGLKTRGGVGTRGASNACQSRGGFQPPFVGGGLRTALAKQQNNNTDSIWSSLNVLRCDIQSEVHTKGREDSLGFPSVSLTMANCSEMSLEDAVTCLNNRNLDDTEVEVLLESLVKRHLDLETLQRSGLTGAVSKLKSGNRRIHFMIRTLINKATKPNDGSNHEKTEGPGAIDVTLKIPNDVESNESQIQTNKCEEYIENYWDTLPLSERDIDWDANNIMLEEENKSEDLNESTETCVVQKIPLDNIVDVSTTETVDGQILELGEDVKGELNEAQREMKERTDSLQQEAVWEIYDEQMMEREEIDEKELIECEKEIKDRKEKLQLEGKLLLNQEKVQKEKFFSNIDNEALANTACDKKISVEMEGAEAFKSLKRTEPIQSSELSFMDYLKKSLNNSGYLTIPGTDKSSEVVPTIHPTSSNVQPALESPESHLRETTNSEMGKQKAGTSEIENDNVRDRNYWAKWFRNRAKSNKINTEKSNHNLITDQEEIGDTSKVDQENQIVHHTNVENTVAGGSSGKEIGDTSKVDQENQIVHHTNVENTVAGGSSGKTKFKCDTCGSSFQYMKNYEIHTAKQMCGLKPKCSNCNKKFKSIKTLKQHIKNTHEKPLYECDKCNLIFPNIGKIEKHFQHHHEEKTCIHCNRIFKNSNTLRSHRSKCKSRETIEAVDKELKNPQNKSKTCKTCGKKFAARAGLNKHKKTHLVITNREARDVLNEAMLAEVEVPAEEELALPFEQNSTPPEPEPIKEKKSKKKKSKEIEKEDTPMVDADKNVKERQKQKKKRSKEKDKENVEGEMEADMVITNRNVLVLNEGTRAEIEVPTKEVPSPPEPAQVKEDFGETTEEKKSKRKKDKNKKRRSKKMDKQNVEEFVHSDGASSKKTKKRKLNDSAMDVNETPGPEAKTSKFDWDVVISSFLEKQTEKEMSIKKLRKRCIREYMSEHEGTHKTEQDLLIKLNKKLKKPKYKVFEDRVALKTDSEEDAEENINVKTPATCEEKLVSAPPVPKEATNCGSSVQKEKFRGLMGNKSKNPPEAVKVVNKRDKKLFKHLLPEM